MKHSISVLGLILLFCLGLGVLLYPSVSDWLYRRNTTKALKGYTESVEALAPYDKEEQLRLARAYNDSLIGNNIKDPFVPGSGIVLPDNYTSVLNIDGIMGYVDIPKINVYLPIGHGTSNAVLQWGVGHIEATAFPIGGESTHCVLTGHRGLPEAKLFTDLDRLKDGDVFLLHVLGDTYCYQVDQILIVEPTDVDSLRPYPGEDYCTLITCHPYSVNSHRMLVRGVRIAYSGEELPPEIQEKLEGKAVNWRGLIILGFAALWTLFLVVYGITESRRKKGRHTR